MVSALACDNLNLEWSKTIKLIFLSWEIQVNHGNYTNILENNMQKKYFCNGFSWTCASTKIHMNSINV